MVDVRQFFESRLQRYGNSPRALGWSAEGQRKRFEILGEVDDLGGRKVLDVGCGLGHLHDFFEAKGIRLSYYGLDLSRKLIEKARELHPDVAFEVLDVATKTLPRKADYVFASGVLNVETGKNEEVMRRLLKTSYEACHVAVAVNMLSTWADWFEQNRHYYDPTKMVRLARRLTRRVVFRHDYMPHDFTLYPYREDES